MGFPQYWGLELSRKEVHDYGKRPTHYLDFNIYNLFSFQKWWSNINAPHFFVYKN